MLLCQAVHLIAAPYVATVHLSWPASWNLVPFFVIRGCCVGLPCAPGCHPRAVRADMSGVSDKARVGAWAALAVCAEVGCSLENVLPLLREPSFHRRRVFSMVLRCVCLAALVSCAFHRSAVCGNCATVVARVVTFSVAL